jgi:Ribbon-helix-helix protein, copG family
MPLNPSIGRPLEVGSETLSQRASAQGAKTEASAEARRLQLVLPPRAAERLEKLKIDSEAVSYAEVIRAALQFYEFALQQEKAGKIITLVDGKGEAVQVKLII